MEFEIMIILLIIIEQIFYIRKTNELEEKISSLSFTVSNLICEIKEINKTIEDSNNNRSNERSE